MRIERLVPCPPEDLWRALIQNTELGKHGAMLRLALPGGLSRPRGRSGLRIAAGARVRLGRRRAALGAPAARLHDAARVHPRECAAQWMAYLESIEALATRAAGVAVGE